MKACESLPQSSEEADSGGGVPGHPGVPVSLSSSRSAPSSPLGLVTARFYGQRPGSCYTRSAPAGGLALSSVCACELMVKDTWRLEGPRRPLRARPGPTGRYGDDAPHLLASAARTPPLFRDGGSARPLPRSRWCLPGGRLGACAGLGCAVTALGRPFAASDGGPRAPPLPRHGRPASEADQDQDRRREAVGAPGTGESDASPGPPRRGGARLGRWEPLRGRWGLSGEAEGGPEGASGEQARPCCGLRGRPRCPEPRGGLAAVPGGSAMPGG